jgi:hypothetical protein
LSARITTRPRRRTHSEQERLRRRRLDQRRYALKRLYGNTPEEYEALVIAQGHRCGVCGGRFSDEPGTPHIEHRHHGDRAVRSVSHPSCNKIIGLAREDVTKLLACVTYLAYHEG